MDILAFCQWLENQPFPVTIAESTWLFPTIESVHVVALVLVVGSIMLVDLRLLSLSSLNIRVKQLFDEILPLTWSAFAVAAASGLLLFSSRAVEYYGNFPFRVKMVLLTCAGLNMLVFHLTTYRAVQEWEQQQPFPQHARAAGALSLLFWISIVVFGRWIGFV